MMMDQKFGVTALADEELESVTGGNVLEDIVDGIGNGFKKVVNWFSDGGKNVLDFLGVHEFLHNHFLSIEDLIRNLNL